MTNIPAGFLTANKPLPHARHIFGTREVTSIGAATERFGAIAHMGQVHGNRVVYAENSGLYEECDGIFTDREEMWLAVKTADCAPVLLSSPAAVAAVHAGWRGVQSEVVPAAIEILCAEFGQTPEDIHVALGPCLAQDNFEVEERFEHYFNVPNPSRFFAHHREGFVKMDMAGIIRAQALACGVLDIHFYHLARCTFGEKETFHSYRRDKGDAGRQLSLVRRG